MRSGWRLWFFVLLFLIPIPFSPWWLSIICFAAYGLLMARLLPKEDSK
jgi:hypothetical protein